MNYNKLKLWIILLFLDIILIESVWVHARVSGRDYIFTSAFPLWKLFHVDYMFHLALFGTIMLFTFMIVEIVRLEHGENKTKQRRKEILKKRNKEELYERVGTINSQLREDAKNIRQRKKTRKRGDNPVDLDKGKTKKMAMPT